MLAPERTSPRLAADRSRAQDSALGRHDNCTESQQSAPVSPDVSVLPESMRTARRWLVWKSQPQAGKKPRKVPHYVDGSPRCGVLDSPEDMARLGSLNDARLALATGGYTGLGFALGPDGDGHWQGIDLDDIAEHPGLAEVADDLPGYTELSPSGKGRHAIGYGSAFGSLGSNASGVEAYAGGRYFTVTCEGAGMGEPVDLAPFVAERLRPMHGPIKQEAERSETSTVTTPSDPPDERQRADLRSALGALRADDRDLWVRVGLALRTGGEGCRALWLEWSQTSTKWAPEDAGQWDTFAPVRTHWRAVFDLAQSAGWINPATIKTAEAVAEPQEDTPNPDKFAELVAGLLVPYTDAELAAAEVPHPHLFRSGQVAAFPVGEASILAAPGREGKTKALVGLSVPFVLGRPVAGMSVSTAGSVVFLSAEDDRISYARALLPHLRRLSPDDQRLALQRIIVPDLDTAAVRASRKLVAMIDRTPMVAPEVQSFINALQPLCSGPDPLRCVIIETGSTWSEGDEGNQALRAMAQACTKIARSLDVAVILAHHTSQAAAANLASLDVSSYDVRGGTSLVFNTRQTWLMVGLGADDDPLPDNDARTILRRMVARGISDRVTAMVCVDSSKAANPPPIFWRWTGSAHGPALVECPPGDLYGKGWRQVREAVRGAKGEAAGARRAETYQADVEHVARLVTTMVTDGIQPTARKVSDRAGRSAGWATKYLESGVMAGQLVATDETVPRVKGEVRVYRPAPVFHGDLSPTDRSSDK